jgi:endonuclease YncB( thermonuclease family)
MNSPISILALPDVQLEFATNDIEEFNIDDYQCYGRVVDVYDGDTISVVIVQFKQLVKYKVRLFGIDTPEMKPKKKDHPNEESRQEEKEFANVAKRLVSNLILGKTVWIHFIEKGKYGRYLAKVYVLADVMPSKWKRATKVFRKKLTIVPKLELSSWMVENKYAIKYMGGKKIKFDPSQYDL